MESLIELGYIGLFFASFLASTIIPLSSEVVMLGLIALKFDPVICIIIATFGNWLGGLTSYGLGYLGKWEWIEKYLKIKKEKIKTFHYKMKKYGAVAGLLTWLPIVGDLISLSMGFIRTKFIPTALFMFLGRGLRYVFWTFLYLKIF